MIDKAKIAARIRAMREKTVANGCTEDEAASAAAMVAAMLAKYNMTLDECDIRQSEFSQQTYTCDDLVGERLWKIADGIAHMIGVRYWCSRPGEPSRINFFGLDHEVEIATYLLEICHRAMEDKRGQLEREFRLLRPTVSRRKLTAFLDGMADRLRQRIRDLRPPQPVGTGLVVLKNELLDAELKNRGINLGDRRTRASRNLEHGYVQGLAAGDAVALNRGIRGGDTVAGRIGHC